MVLLLKLLLFGMLYLFGDVDEDLLLFEEVAWTSREIEIFLSRARVSIYDVFGDFLFFIMNEDEECN